MHRHLTLSNRSSLHTLAYLIEAVREVDGKVVHIDPDALTYISGREVLQTESGRNIVGLVMDLAARVIRLELNAMDSLHRSRLEDALFDSAVTLAHDDGRESGIDKDGETFITAADIEAALNDHPDARRVLEGLADKWGLNLR